MEEDDLALRPETLLMLQQFMQEKEESEEKFRKLEDAAEKQHQDIQAQQITMTDFGEDWQLSQFWYSEETAEKLAREILLSSKELGKEGDEYKAACVSAPSAFVAFRNKLSSEEQSKINIHIFEFDKRFSLYKEDYSFYDFNDPFNLDIKFKNSFDYVLADPPFLSDECWEKTAATVKWLLKPNGRILLCTGKIMTEKLNQVLGCLPTKFDPEHANGLSNEFGCFSNYNSKIN